ncbi:MAG TPA: hypothetical protein VNL69_13130 [Bacteroidota bacterium]|nr:hypothetical protein [Bacteroidota bacterium]
MAHNVFIAFLFVVSLAAILAIGIHGFAYYTTPVSQRPFRPDYEIMKPSGTYSHGLGIIGSSMIITGVAMYSTRKRVRALWNLGRLSRWLEVHIFLCLLGPILVIFHTTFKAGGIAAVSLWCMVSVAASGIVGRFLYVQIPRNLKGTELTDLEIARELERMGEALARFPFGRQLIEQMDEQFSSLKKPSTMRETLMQLIRLQAMKRRVRHMLHVAIGRSGLASEQARGVFKLASSRAALIQKTVLLAQMERLFFYWHAVHLPFTVIMFLTLAAHVAVTIVLGYRWIF